MSKTDFYDALGVSLAASLAWRFVVAPALEQYLAAGGGRALQDWGVMLATTAFFTLLSAVVLALFRRLRWWLRQRRIYRDAARDCAINRRGL